MPDYYTSDATQMPYSAIFTSNGLPLWIRLVFAFRKAAGWHYTAAHARCAPERWRGLEMGDLPVSARQGLESVVPDIERHGFSLFGIARSDTIGMQVGYNAVLIADDRTTVCTITALRTGLGTMSRSAFATGFRSDLADGTILLTGRGPKLPSFMFRPHQRIEMLPETTQTDELVRRHRERMGGISEEQIVHIPTDGVADYLLARAKGDWEDFMATGMSRKLSAREEARLREIQFDFE
jgi:hypothetical protein